MKDLFRQFNNPFQINRLVFKGNEAPIPEPLPEEEDLSEGEDLLAGLSESPEEREARLQHKKEAGREAIKKAESGMIELMGDQMKILTPEEYEQQQVEKGNMPKAKRRAEKIRGNQKEQLLTKLAIDMIRVMEGKQEIHTGDWEINKDIVSMMLQSITEGDDTAMDKILENTKKLKKDELRLFSQELMDTVELYQNKQQDKARAKLAYLLEKPVKWFAQKVDQQSAKKQAVAKARIRRPKR